MKSVTKKDMRKHKNFVVCRLNQSVSEQDSSLNHYKCKVDLRCSRGVGCIDFK